MRMHQIKMEAMEAKKLILGLNQRLPEQLMDE